MKRLRLPAVVVIVVVALVGLAGCDWAQFGFGPNAASFDPVEPVLTPASVTHMKVAWSTPCSCLQPALSANGLVYTSDTGVDNAPRDVTLDIRDAATGAVRWSATLRQITDARFIGVANGLAYVRVGSLPLDGASDTSDLLLALDATTGALRWFVVPPSPSEGTVTISSWVLDGPRLFVTTVVRGSGYLVSAIDTTGHAVWSANAPGTVQGMVADPGHALYVVSFAGGSGVLTSYAEATGSVLAQHPADFGPLGLVFPTPVRYANGLIYAESNANSSSGNHVRAVAVRVDTGVQAWSALDQAVVALPPGVAITVGGGVFARDATTGSVLWSHPPSGTWEGPDAAATRDVVFTGESGLSAFRLSDGAALGAAPVRGEITISNGRVFVAGASQLVVLAPT